MPDVRREPWRAPLPICRILHVFLLHLQSKHKSELNTITIIQQKDNRELWKLLPFLGAEHRAE